MQNVCIAEVISTVRPPPAIMFANMLIICVVDTLARAYYAFVWRIIGEISGSAVLALSSGSPLRTCVIIASDDL